MAGPSPESNQIFDNRWMAFPQDFSSGTFLRKQGIRKVVLVHDTFSKEPAEDLAHVLLRWQEEGIAIESKSARFGGCFACHQGEPAISISQSMVSIAGRIGTAAK